MRYLPRSIRIKQHGITATVDGMGEGSFRNGQVVLDFHGLFGKYEMEEEFMTILVTAFNNYVKLSDEVQPDYEGLMEAFKEQQRKGKKK